MAEEKVEKPKEEKKKVKKGKKPHKNKPVGKKYKHYKIVGAKLSRGQSCPRCGPTVFLAKHEGRVHCGRCSYTEFNKK